MTDEFAEDIKQQKAAKVAEAELALAEAKLWEPESVIVSPPNAPGPVQHHNLENQPTVKEAAKVAKDNRESTYKIGDTFPEGKSKPQNK